MKTLSLFIIFFFITGCASKIMQNYIGKDIREVVIDYGPPSNAFDLGNGTRVFQWTMQKSYKMPTYINTSGSIRTQGTIYGSTHNYGNFQTSRANLNATSWINTNTTISGGQTIHSKCIYTLFARWNKQRNGWIVTGFKKPPLMCE